MACVLVAVLGSSLVVWQSAYAGFSASSAPVTARVATGTLVLTDDDAASTLFTAANVKAGGTGTRCIQVTAGGSAPSTVRLYGTARSNTNNLAGALRLTVRVGTGGSTASCSGFVSAGTVYDGTLAGFTAAGFAAGLGSWNAPGGTPQNRTYHVTWTLPVDAPRSAQGGSAAVTFVWEARTR